MPLLCALNLVPQRSLRVGAGVCPAGACLEAGNVDSGDVSDTGSGGLSGGTTPADKDEEDCLDDDDTTAEDCSDVGRDRDNEHDGFGGSLGGNFADVDIRSSHGHGSIGSRGGSSSGGFDGDAHTALSEALLKQESRLQQSSHHNTSFGTPQTQHQQQQPPLLRADRGQYAVLQAHQIPVPTFALNQITGGASGGEEGGGGGGMPNVAMCLPSLLSLASLDTLPLTASTSEDDLNAFGAASAAAFEDAAINPCLASPGGIDEGVASLTPLLVSDVTSVDGDGRVSHGYGVAYGSYGGDGVGNMTVGGGASGDSASPGAWVVGEGM